MIQAGNNIKSPEDALIKIKVEQLYHSLRSPKPEIESKIRQLRIIRDIDEKQYAMQKRQLPYFVCGLFNPTFRRTENFAYTEYFILDIDHLSNKGLTIDGIKEIIERDERVLLCFTSPGEDGLKIMFKLTERCYDAGLYSLFYKSFSKNFSEQYGLQQVIDERTSDVTRACFISIDRNAYYNENATAVNMNAFLDLQNPDALFKKKHELEKKQEKDLCKDSESQHEQDKEPDGETVTRIKALLNPKGRKTKEEKSVVVPQILDDIMAGLKMYIEQTGAIINETKNIQYGKKIRVQVGMKQAEVNLFFGKHGFSIVKSPKCGTSEEMNALLADLVGSFINTYSL